MKDSSSSSAPGPGVSVKPSEDQTRSQSQPVVTPKSAIGEAEEPAAVRGGLRPDPNLFNNVTHYPERRAAIYERELADRLQAIRDKAVELSTRPGAAPITDEVVPALIARHERMTQAMWQAEGRCASWFIVGPANFPKAAEEKRQRSLDRRGEEVSAHLAAALRRLERIAFPHGMGDAIRSADPEALDKLRAELAEVEKRHEMAKIANGILRQYGSAARPQLEAAGLSEKMIASALVCDASGRPFGFFTNNSAASIRRIKDRISGLERMKARGTVERNTNLGVRVVENAEAARIQLVFPDKPDEARRAILKSNGFRWAPSEGAWQRHLSNAGRWASQRVLDQLTALLSSEVPPLGSSERSEAEDGHPGIRSESFPTLNPQEGE